MDGETIIAILIGAALACFSLVMVGYAFFRGDGSGIPNSGLAAPEPGEEDDAVGVGLESLYDSIDTLELEYQLGNMPGEQYLEQMQAYRLEAAELIRAQLDSGSVTPELNLERDVIAARAGLRALGMSGGWSSCPLCDAPVPASEALCPHCGATITPRDGSVPTASSETAPQQ